MKGAGNYWYWLVFCVVVLLPINVHCQEYAMLHYTVNDGLPGNTVYSTYKDSKGFLWVGTDKGIARYNGINFEVFTTFGGVPDNEVLFFQEDYYGRLWLGTYNGQLCYYKNDTFHTSANTPLLKTVGQAKSFTKNIYNQYDSSINIEYSEGLSFTNINRNHCKQFSLEDQYTTFHAISSIAYTHKQSGNGYLLVSNSGVFSIDSNNNIKHHKPNTDDAVHTIYSQNQDQYYYINNNKIVLYNLIDSLTYPNRHDARVAYFDGNNLSVITQKGQLFINDKLIPIKGIASSVTQDIKGNYWIGTTANGIYVLNKNFNNTIVYRNAYSNTARLCQSFGDSMLLYGDSYNLYSLRGARITKLTNYRNELARYVPAEPTVFFLDNLTKLYSFNHYTINILEGLTTPKKNKANASIDYLNNSKTIAHSGSKVYLTTHNRVLYASDSALRKTKDLKFTEVRIPKERIFYSHGNNDDSSFWFSTISGTYKIDRTGNLQTITTTALKCFEFVNDHIVGYTHSNELLVFSNLAGKLVVDTIKSDNCIWNKLYAIGNSSILISTNNLYRLLTVPQHGQNTIVTVESEFAPLYADGICADKTNLYFFKDSSITALNIHDLLAPSPPPQLFWGRVTTGKRTYLINNVAEIPFKESGNVKISFSALSFGSKKIKYEYSVSANGTDIWHDVNDKEINLIHPGYGRYTVKMRARTLSSVYSAPISFVLEIQRPFWATSWFIALAIATGIIAFFSAIFFTRQLALQKAARKHEHVELELKSVYSQLNPHFIFNSLNAAMYLVQMQRLEDAYRHIYKFSSLLRSYIKSSRNRFITLEEEIKNLSNYIELQQERFNKKFNYTISIDPIVDTGTLIPSLLIQPLVENAINHGLRHKPETGNLAIEFNVTEKGTTLHCAIDDDGIGRAKSALVKDKNKFKGESYGSDLIKDLINILNKSGRIKIEIEYIDKISPLTGTTVLLKIKNTDKK